MSIIHVTDSKKTGTHVDRTSFLGAKVPDEIRIMVKHLKHIDRPTLRKLLQVIMSSMQGTSVEYSQVAALQSEKLTEETLAFIYSGLLKLLQKAMRVPLVSMKQEVFKEDLQELKIPDEFVADISSVVFKAKQSHIGEKVNSNAPSLPKLQSFRWRLDVAISTSVLNRALEPAILMETVLSDGTVQNFEVPLSKFHELRYNVAFMLKEMENLEKRNILKVQD